MVKYTILTIHDKHLFASHYCFEHLFIHNSSLILSFSIILHLKCLKMSYQFFFLSFQIWNHGRTHFTWICMVIFTNFTVILYFTTREVRFYIGYLKYTTSVYDRHHKERHKKGKPILRRSRTTDLEWLAFYIGHLRIGVECIAL